jgi:hypothetical protein
MTSKQLLLTFDYELFLGSNSGSVLKCMIEPTYKIQAILKKHKVQAIFFVDTTYLYRLVEVAKNNMLASSDLDKIMLQLKSLANDGHYLYHHLHPHWLDAVYNEETNIWDCSNHTRFALSNLSIEDIRNIVEFSDTLLRSVYPENKIPAYFGFRAGGLYSQPFERLTSLFKDKKIKYEFSVLQGAFSKQLNFSFDYLDTLNLNSLVYRFEASNTQVDPTGYFVEFSMNHFSMHLFQRILNSIYYRLNAKKSNWQRFGDGSSSGNKIQNKKKDYTVKETFSIELLNKIKTTYYISYLKKHPILHLISHPKLISEQSLDSFDLFLSISHKKFQINTQFESFPKID